MDGAEATTILKRDALGRVTVSREQRDALLDDFCVFGSRRLARAFQVFIGFLPNIILLANLAEKLLGFRVGVFRLGSFLLLEVVTVNMHIEWPFRFAPGPKDSELSPLPATAAQHCRFDCIGKDVSRRCGLREPATCG